MRDIAIVYKVFLSLLVAFCIIWQSIKLKYLIKIIVLFHDLFGSGMFLFPCKWPFRRIFRECSKVIFC